MHRRGSRPRNEHRGTRARSERRGPLYEPEHVRERYGDFGGGGGSGSRRVRWFDPRGDTAAKDYGERGYDDRRRESVTAFAGYGSENARDDFSGPHAGRGPAGYRRSDDRISEEICEALTQHSHVDASQIHVQVKSGDVTLSGGVATRQQKRLAEDLAEAARGVGDVRNELRVQPHESGLSSSSRDSGTPSAGTARPAESRHGADTQQRK